MNFEMETLIPVALDFVLDRDPSHDLPDDLLATAVADRARLMAGDGAD